jgi:CTP synthase
MKYIIVCGSVLSGLGKGIITSSIGVLLKSIGYSVTAIKIDPYLNIDAGTLTPYDHGEVYVLDSGAEVDLDLGNYERFLDIRLTPDHNITTGKIYRKVIEDERKGNYLGKTVQIVPHLTDAIQDWIEKVSHIPVSDHNMCPDVCLIELGGTVGDIESAPFIEAIRQFQFRVGKGDFFLVNVSYIPHLQEHKTKPTQSSIKDLRGLGLSPNVIVCRSEKPISKEIREKISRFCHVCVSDVLSVPNMESIYEVPKVLYEQKILNCISNIFVNYPVGIVDTSFYENWVVKKYEKSVKIAIVGKYTNLSDSYYSLVQSLRFASNANNRKLEIQWIESETLEGELSVAIKADGILVPGGFGDRGTLGMINAIKYARENKIPYLGICLGMQLAVVEFCRSVLNLVDANSTEFDSNTSNPVVIYMPEISQTHMGGTMRLGLKNTHIIKDGLVKDIYQGKDVIEERHRHRYEVNINYRNKIESNGLLFSGWNDTGERVEAIELQDHPFFVGVQFHPEYQGRPLNPHPLFKSFIESCLN